MSEPTAEDIALAIERQIAEIFAYPEYAQWLETEPEVTVEVVYGFPKDTYTHQTYSVANNYYEDMRKQQERILFPKPAAEGERLTPDKIEEMCNQIGRAHV